MDAKSLPNGMTYTCKRVSVGVHCSATQSNQIGVHGLVQEWKKSLVQWAFFSSVGSALRHTPHQCAAEAHRHGHWWKWNLTLGACFYIHIIWHRFYSAYLFFSRSLLLHPALLNSATATQNFHPIAIRLPGRTGKHPPSIHNNEPLIIHDLLHYYFSQNFIKRQPSDIQPPPTAFFRKSYSRECAMLSNPFFSP